MNLAHGKQNNLLIVVRNQQRKSNVHSPSRPKMHLHSSIVTHLLKMTFKHLKATDEISRKYICSGETDVRMTFKKLTCKYLYKNIFIFPPKCSFYLFLQDAIIYVYPR